MHIFFYRFCLLIALAAWATLPSPARQTEQPPARIGNYSIAPYGSIKMLRRPTGDSDFVLTGQSGRPMLAKSPDYEITAPRMEVSIRGAKRKPTRFVATGSVKVVNRNRQTGQKTVITCQEVRYTATTAASDRGVMRLIGNVRSETTDTTLAAPLLITGDTGTATFLPDGTLDVTLDASGDSGKMSGQVYEPATKGAKP